MSSKTWCICGEYHIPTEECEKRWQEWEEQQGKHTNNTYSYVIDAMIEIQGVFPFIDWTYKGGTFENSIVTILTSLSRRSYSLGAYIEIPLKEI
jgi:hypothetical protein